jgi:hypothetical protein
MAQQALDQSDKVDLCRDILESIIRLSLNCTDEVRSRYPDSAAKDGLPDRAAAILLHMASISGRSLLMLTEEIGLEVRDCFPIARSIVEACVNASFILASGPEMAERAFRHARQKGYRDLEREWSVGGTQMGVRWTGELSDEVHAEMKPLVAEFTDVRGWEKDWTSETLRQKLGVIEERFASTSALLISTAAFMIYKVASEVAHGSVFGAMYFWGFTRPNPRSSAEDDFLRALDDHRFEVLIAAIHSLVGALECFAEYIGSPDLKSRAGDEFRRLLDNPEIAAAVEDGS